jgi:signal transduction histidine kinase
MVKGGRRGAKVFVIALGALTVALAIALNIGWIVLNWRTGVYLVLGVLFFALIITGLVLNTIFLFREIRRNEQHDAFINAVTHELKTPVASMRLYLQTLESRKDIGDEKKREFYKIMLADTDRLMSTIEQVLRAARTASTKPLLRAPVNLRELAEECVALARLRYHLAEDALQLMVPAQLNTWVLGDVEELKAAISNLLDNAVKYSAGNVSVAVEVDEAEANFLALRVRDSGVGIPQRELKRIFKRFYRIPSTMALRVKGTGLGLFIVRSIAERHGGRVFAESEGAGRGSTFTIELPAAPAHR